MSALELRFFNNRQLKSGITNNSTIEKVTADLIEKNSKNNFIENLALNYGFPDWEKTWLFIQGKDTLAQVPLFSQDGTETNAILTSIIKSDGIKHLLLRRDKYNFTEKQVNAGLTAKVAKNLFIYYDFIKYGKSSYWPEANYSVNKQLKASIAFVYTSCQAQDIYIGMAGYPLEYSYTQWINCQTNTIWVNIDDPDPTQNQEAISWIDQGDTGGPPAGGCADINNQLNNLISSVVAYTENISSTEIEEDINTKKVFKTWIMAKFMLVPINVTSHEELTKVRSNPYANWEWTSITHKMVDLDGQVAGFVIEVQTIYDYPYVSPNVATIEVAIKLKASAVCDGFPIFSYIPITNHNAWNIE